MGSVVDDVEYVINDATLKQVLNSAKLLELKSQWTKACALDRAFSNIATTLVHDAYDALHESLLGLWIPAELLFGPAGSGLKLKDTSWLVGVADQDGNQDTVWQSCPSSRTSPTGPRSPH